MSSDAKITIDALTISDIGSSFTIDVSNSDTALTSNSITMQIINCPSGFGIDSSSEDASTSSQCAECSSSYFSFENNNASCYWCGSENKLDGVECRGGNEIIIDYSHWMAVHTEWDASRTGLIPTLTSSDCPIGYCCQDTNGCNYYNDYYTISNGTTTNVYDSNICAYGRDPTVPLCGACIDGFTEYFGSADCGDCSEGGAWYLIYIPIILSWLFSFYLVFFAQYSEKYLRAVQQQQNILNQAKLMSSTAANGAGAVATDTEIKSLNSMSQDDGNDAIAAAAADGGDTDTHITPVAQSQTQQLGLIQQNPAIAASNNAQMQRSMELWKNVSKLQIMIFKPISYYMQSLSYIVTQGTITVYLNFLLQLFNLSLDFNDGGSNSGSEKASGLCLFGDVSAMGEILWNFMIPLLLFVELLVYFLCCRAVKRVKIKGRKANISMAFWQIVLLSLGVIISIVLKLLACREVITNVEVKNTENDGGISYEYMTKSVHFYAGDRTCYGAIWVLADVFWSCMVLVSILVFFHLYRKSPKQRENPNFTMRNLVYAFKREYWFWEFVLLSRRFVVFVHMFESKVVW